jgi:general secretion pathway protein K
MKRQCPSYPQRGGVWLLVGGVRELVTTLAAGMVWQQWRAIQVEAAERGRTQAAWILLGALDWARLILREDQRENNRGNPPAADYLGEPWAVPLAEARLSSFLAADRDNNSVAENDSLDAFLSGSITDAQSRWNLRRLSLIDPTTGKPAVAELKALKNLCDLAGAPGDCADRIASAVGKAWGPAGGGTAAAISPQQLSQLTWLGIDAETIKRLEPWVDILPEPTDVNINTAPAEVIAATVDGMSLGNAQRLVQERQRTPIRDLNAATTRAYFPGAAQQTPPPGIGLTSRFFYIQGRLRLEERVLEERSLVERNQNLDVKVRSRERVNLREGVDARAP